MTTADRIYLWAGVDLTADVGNRNTTADLNIEGTLNGDYDSQIDVPLPFAPAILKERQHEYLCVPKNMPPVTFPA